jgi:Flp pilus assembly protein TadB
VALAIVVLLLWIATAAAGLTLLGSGSAARRAAAVPDPVAAAPVRIGAAALTAEGKAPPIRQDRLPDQEGDHTLLEFSHIALAITGIGCWMMFAFVHYPPLAWIAFGVLVATLLMGLGWLTASRRAARRRSGDERDAGWSFPPRLIWLHGTVAACSLTLTALTAVVASRA